MPTDNAPGPWWDFSLDVFAIGLLSFALNVAAHGNWISWIGLFTAMWRLQKRARPTT